MGINFPSDVSASAASSLEDVGDSLQKSLSVKVKKGTLTKINTQETGSTDHSLGSIIATAAGGNKPKKTSADGKLDQIIPNFVSKHVKSMVYRKQVAAQKTADAAGVPVNTLELKPGAEESFAAVVMVDVSGYSKLTATLAQRGSVGAELLAKTMKAYLDQIIETINNHDGDIVKFAGDAVIVCWRSDQLVDLFDNDQDAARGELVYKAAQCCLRLLTELGTYAIDIKDCDTRLLRIHLGIGAGLISDVIVGGETGRWEHFIAGEGVLQLAQVLDLAKAAGELALSHQALKWLAHVIDIRTLNLGNYDKRCIILTGLETAMRKGGQPVIPPDTLLQFDSQAQWDANLEIYKYFMDKTALFKLQADVNQSRLFGTDANLTELLNLAELRQVTTVFIRIGSLKTSNPQELLELSQSAMNIVLSSLGKFEGNLRQFHVDDKGAVILCFFGLPPMAHDNDAILGMRAGVEIRDRFLDVFEDFSIGITTGVVSYGGVGAPGRAEYAVMGDAINMAARLMCLTDAKEGILCDIQTYNLCNGDFSFEDLGEVKVKGKAHAIPVFRPLSAIPQADGPSPKKGKESFTMIGRQTEKDAIQNVLDSFSQKTVGCLLFQGDGGQGLTTLADYTFEQFASKSITHWYLH
ncbi:nucleotide cyclase [Gorgonomyces haynaldii]|nr:nucleotide cyclase [Gorgonomyces haynaldii]